MRPGRLDRLIYVGPPTYEDRIDILKVKMKNMAVDPDVNVVRKRPAPSRYSC